MRRWLSVGVVAVAGFAGCGSSDPGRELTGTSASQIQGGTEDTTHLFVVGVVQLDQQSANMTAIEFCSGVLLAPNLVATARHCVATLTSPQITCGSSVFGGVVNEGAMYVSNESQIESVFVQLAPGGIIVPTGAGEADVCGNDIALLILADDIVITSTGSYIDHAPDAGTHVDMSNYVVPAINPRMTDPSYSTKVTAIGYGIDTPTDDAGVTAGIRRIKENIPIACIPDDTVDPALNCFAGSGASTARTVLTTSEFVSGDASTCEGDSGSGAFDQGYFDKGDWVSFGVLSRGSVSDDGQTCIQPIYTRFDAWNALLVSAAKQAQSMSKSGYPLPLWAGGTAVNAIFPPSGSSSGGTSTTTGLECVGGQSASAGAPCACANDCASNECVTADGTNYICADPCTAGQCTIGFTCQGSGSNSYCFPGNGTSPPPSKSGGCAASPAGLGGPGAQRSGAASLAGLVLALSLGLRRVRRRSRRGAAFTRP